MYKCIEHKKYYTIPLPTSTESKPTQTKSTHKPKQTPSVKQTKQQQDNIHTIELEINLGEVLDIFKESYSKREVTQEEISLWEQVTP